MLHSDYTYMRHEDHVDDTTAHAGTSAAVRDYRLDANQSGTEWLVARTAIWPATARD